MAKFPAYFIDKLRDSLLPSQVLGKYVKLTPKGRGEFGALCPFHNEKTPSFTVSDDKGFYHCFGCGAHGDIIGFLIEHKRLSYPEAIEQLANEAGLEIPKLTPQDEIREKQYNSLQEINELAAEFFENQLYSAAGSKALEYVKNRGLSPETIKKFRIGYSPNNLDSLKNFLLQKNIPEDLQLAAGVVSKTDDRPAIDRFRNRLMFPISNASGKVIAFGGRALSPEDNPKYLNTGETELFKKGNQLYALNHARESARESAEIIVVEGYMDVIACHTAGINNVVAPLGTALTENQLKLLWKLAKEPTLCLDGDTAGMRATARAAESYVELLEPGFSMKFALLPAGQDPDDLIKKSGAEALQSILSGAVPLSEILWQVLINQKTIKTPEQIAGLEKSIAELTGRLKNQALRKLYSEFFSQKIWENFRRGKKNQNVVTGLKSLEIRHISAEKRSKIENIEAMLLEHIRKYPQLLLNHEIEEELASLEFSTEKLDKTRKNIIEMRSEIPAIVLENNKQLEWQYLIALKNLLAAQAELEVFQNESAESWQEKSAVIMAEIARLTAEVEEKKQLIDG